MGAGQIYFNKQSQLEISLVIHVWKVNIVKTFCHIFYDADASSKPALGGA